MSRRPANDKPTLSRDAVVEAALAIARKEGVSRLTIRKLAQSLDVSPMAIYWHVENKDKLFFAMGDRVCRDIVLAADPTQPWHEQLRTIYSDLRITLARYPGAASIVVPRILYSDKGRDITEASLRLLRSAGFDLGDATRLARHGTRLVIALVLEPVFTDETRDPVRRTKILDGYVAMLRKLPPRRYPNLIESAPVIGRFENPEQFNALGIDIYINGLIALAAKRTLTGPGARPRSD